MKSKLLLFASILVITAAIFIGCSKPAVPKDDENPASTETEEESEEPTNAEAEEEPEAASVEYDAPKIVSMSVFPVENKIRARLIFASEEGGQYAIYRKPIDGEWEKIDTVEATSEETRYYDTITQDYVYTVKRFETDKNGQIIESPNYDEEGIQTIISVPKLTLDATNLDTTISWDPVEGADSYLVYIKVGTEGEYRRLKETTKTSYKYTYYRKLKTEEEINATAEGASHKYFVAPDSNPFVYAVRPCKKTGSKVSYGNHLQDGEYSVITPNVLAYDGKILTWHTVKNANYYQIYTSDNGEDWTALGKIAAGEDKSQEAEVPEARFYGVSSIVEKNGEVFESDFDKGFDVSHRTMNTDKNMLWIGCSIEWGSPYYGENDILYVNSYPSRISQCTGVKFFNPSVPGSTLAARYDEKGNLDANRYRLIRHVVEHVKNGENTEGTEYCEKENTQTLADFDIIVIPAGGNDYSDNIEPGTPSDMIDTTYYGAFNMTLAWIDEANAEREDLGKDPIKVVFIPFFYSDRIAGKFLEKHDRFVTPNQIGLTYTDYRDVMYDVYKRRLEKDENTYWIENQGYVTAENSPYVTSDNLHLTRFTYSQVGNGFAKDMIEQGILD